MIAYCTHCWAEIDSAMKRCPKCGSDLTLDERPYDEKIVGALNHPLAEARQRACWLLGSNGIDSAATRLIEVANTDEDLFVRRAAVEALGHLRAPEARKFLEDKLQDDDHLTGAIARNALEQLSTPMRENGDT